MLRKRKSAAQAAAQEALDAHRDDLQRKQLTEIGILDEYAGTVEVMPEEEVRAAVQKVVESLRSQGDSKPGSVMKELFKSGGALDKQSVEKAEVAKIVQETIKPGAEVEKTNSQDLARSNSATTNPTESS